MKKYHQFISKIKGQRGISAVVVAIVIAVLLGFVALAVDIGYVAATKNELQNVADAAALAAAGELGNQYITNTNPLNYSNIKTVAYNTAVANKAAGLSIKIIDPDADVLIGIWDQNAIPPLPKFNSSGTPPNAVKVTARRDGGANGPITTFFAKIFGIQTVDVMADAIASLTGAGEIPEVQLPIGVSSKWFDKTGCLQHIDFKDTKDSCAGWHNFNLPPSGISLTDRLLGMITGDGCPNGDCSIGPTDDDIPPNGIDENDIDLSTGEGWWLDTTPNIPATHSEDYSGYNLPARNPAAGANLGDGFNYQGGVISKLFNSSANQPAPMMALFDYYRTHDDDADPNDSSKFNPVEFTQPDGSIGIDSTLPPDGSADITNPDLVWSTYVPVYYEDPSSQCMNPNTNLPVDGFARIYVLGVYGPPLSTVDVRLPTCNWTVIEERGGGGIGPVLGYIPNLVE